MSADSSAVLACELMPRCPVCNTEMETRNVKINSSPVEVVSCPKCKFSEEV